MIPTEAQRQFYLGVAGIRLWYAREPLPGAAPSPEFQFPEPGESVHQPVLEGTPVVAMSATANTPPSTQEASQRGIQRIASLQALMENKEDPATAKETQEQRPPVTLDQSIEEPEDDVAISTQTQGDTTQAMNLSMGVFSNDRHILIAHISKEASLRLQEALATNILKSLGERHLEKPAWVHWPVFNNRLVPGNNLSDLKSVMAQVLVGCGDKKVIVLGSLEGGAAISDWLADVLQRGPDIEFEHALAELASNPGLKRTLWQKLKPLAGT